MSARAAKEQKIPGGFAPVDDRVLVEPFDPDSVTTGGIVIPATAQEKSLRGRVLAVGPGRLLDTGERVPMNVAVGDSVLYGKHSGLEVELDGAKYQIMRATDLLMVYVEEKGKK